MHNVCTFKSHHENISIFLFREDYVGVNNFYSCDDNSTQTYLTISDIDVLAQIDVKSLNDPNKLMRDLFIEKNRKRWIKYSAVHRNPIEEDFCWCIWVAFFNWIYTGNYQMLNMLKTISFSHWIYVTVFKWTTMWYVFSCYSQILLKNPL